MSVERGTIWEARGQASETFGLLILSANRWNRVQRLVSACPVLRVPDMRLPFPVLDCGQPHCGRVVRVPQEVLETELCSLRNQGLEQVEDSLVGLLALQTVCVDPPRRPGQPVHPSTYPTWSKTYYADPPVEGQRKRWLVVSHDYWNAAAGSVLTVRTTSNTWHQADTFPAIQRGLALACCPDLQVKDHQMFDLASVNALPQATVDDMRRAGFGLANHFVLVAALRRA